MYKKPRINAARVFLAEQILQGVYYTPSKEERGYWLGYAAEAGDPDYMIRYAAYLLEDCSNGQAHETAFFWLCKAAEMLGDGTHKGTWIYHDSDAWPNMNMVRFQKEKEREQLLEAAHKTLLCYYTENEVQQWYHRAIQYGNLEFVEYWGAHLLDSATCEEDYRAAFTMMQDLSKKDCPMAQYYLGQMYLNGHGPEKMCDTEKAIACFSSALWESDLPGLALAEVCFGFYPMAKTVEPDPVMALTGCLAAAANRRYASPENYLVWDILQKIEAWEHQQKDTPQDSKVYAMLAEFYQEYAPESYRERAVAYRKKVEAMIASSNTR